MSDEPEIFAPKDHRSLSSHIRVSDYGDEIVKWSMAGGGISQTMPRSEFDARYSPVTPEEAEAAASSFQRGHFAIDDMEPIEGYSNGEYWNGWAKAWFTREVMLDKVLELHNPNEVYWSDELGSFVLVMNDDEEARARFDLARHIEALKRDGEVEFDDGEYVGASVAEKRTIEVDGERIDIFLIDYGFCWDRMEDFEQDKAPGM